jgi:hypothetical protein
VLVRLALGRRSPRMLSPPQRVGAGLHAGRGPTLDTRTPALGVLRTGLRRAQRPRPSAVRNSGRGLQPDCVRRHKERQDQ